MNSVERVMSVMDNMTPYYKLQFESLPMQQRKILCAIARNNVPMNSTAISKQSRIEARQTSTALTRLKRKNLLVHENRLWRLTDPWLGVWYRFRRGNFDNIPDTPIPQIQSYETNV